MEPLHLFFIIASSILGMLIGSFLNVVALRYHTGRSLKGRSSCASCRHPLSWKELIPLISWLWQHGRCRKCQSHISSYYFYGELMTAIAFGLIAARGIFSPLGLSLDIPYLIGSFFLAVFFSILIVIVQYDLMHKIIPDRLSLAVALMALSALFFFGMTNAGFVWIGFHLPSWWALTAGLIVPLPFALLWIISKGQWIGLGDPKLMVSMGWLLGISKGFTAVVISFWVGAAYAMTLVITNYLFKKRLLETGKKSIMKKEVPFAPFLIIGTMVVILTGLNLFPLSW